MKNFILIFILLLILVFGNTLYCQYVDIDGDDDDDDDDFQPVFQQKRIDKTFASSSLSINKFTFSLFKNLSSKKGNIFYSPFSISSALAMTYAGAKNETANQMAKVMFYETEGKKLHNSFSRLIKHLNEKKGKVNELRTANSLWGMKGYAFRKKYIQFIEKFYSGGFNKINFEKSKVATKKINGWVDDKTNGLIKNLIPAGLLNATTRLVLVNAIYFKGLWSLKFDEKHTKEKPFYLLDGKKKPVAMMQNLGNYKYYEKEDMKIIELDYKGSEQSMVIFLPGKKTGLPAFEKQLDYQLYESCVNKLWKRKVNLHLPRFKMTESFKLADNLKKMGMKNAFSNLADFSLMDSKKDVKIDEVIHKAFVEVNEKGTEAAAATAVVMVTRGSSNRKRPIIKEFNADHPFIFIIRDIKSGSILFVGRLESPDLPQW